MKCAIRPIVLAVVFSLLLSGCAKSPSSSTSDPPSKAGTVLENDQVRLEFYPETGMYSLYDKRRQEWPIRNAYARTGRYKSTDGYAFQWESFRGEDKTGASDILSLSGTMAEKPTLLLEFRLPEDSGQLLIRAGMVNTAEESVRVYETWPLIAQAETGGGVFAGPDPSQGHKVLTGEGGFTAPRLLSQVNAASHNVLTVTYLQEPGARTVVLGGLTTYEFQSTVTVGEAGDQALTEDGRRSFDASIRLHDSAGKQVDPGQTFWGDTAFVDGVTGDPYASLESYGRRVAQAMDVQLQNYNDYISVCLWYVYAFSGGDRQANTSEGAVEEALRMAQSGITRYASALVRLVPDEYVNPNEQLWWDDEHWARYGHLTGRYPTLDGWMTAMKEIGAQGGLYMQPTYLSSDYAARFPEQMLYGSEAYGADYTNPDFIRHMQEVYTRVKNAGITAIFYDYTMISNGNTSAKGNMLELRGGFADPYATAVSAYRNIFRIAKETAGNSLMITENTWDYTGQEVATGLIDAQRSRMDNVTLNQETVKSGIRQWYRNEVTKLIDPDVKNFTLTDPDKRRAEITAMGLMFGKTMLGSSITRYSEKDIRDIGRILPMPLDGISARPVGLFQLEEDQNPQVYDYPLAEDCHLLMLWNTDSSRKTIAVDLDGAPAFGGIGLDGDKTYDVWDFWNERYVGRIKGRDSLEEIVRKNEMRLLIVRETGEAPALLSTNRHLLPGVVDISEWKADASRVSALTQVIGGDPCRIRIALPAESRVQSFRILSGKADGAARVDPLTGLLTVELTAADNQAVRWEVLLEKSDAEPPAVPGQVTGLRAAVDPRKSQVALSWDAQPEAEYRVFRNGSLIGITGSSAFLDNDAAENTAYTYTVAAVNRAGTGGESAPVSITTGWFQPALYTGIGGDFSNRYGKDGYRLYNFGGQGHLSQLPAYILSLKEGSAQSWQWDLDSADNRLLRTPDASPSSLGAIYAQDTLSFRITPRDKESRRLTFYCVDVERQGRSFDFTAVDADGRTIVPEVSVSEYGEGVYLSFTYRGEITCTFRSRAVNAVVSGVFFDS